MIKILKFAFLIYLAMAALSPIQAQDCRCNEVFKKAVDAYEKNYSLFMYKVTNKNRDLYEAHKDLMWDKAKQATNLSDCKAVLEQYLEFFRDGHTYIMASDNQASETYIEHVEFNTEQFKEEYNEKSYQLNPLIGIWNRGSYTVAIVPSQNTSKPERDFVAVVVESSNPKWEKGQVKFELFSNFGTSYQINYMMGDHSVNKTSGEQKDIGTLEIDEIGEWQKLWPEVENQKKRSEIELKFNEFHISYIEDIPYLRLPDFYSVEPSYIDSIMKTHHDKILESDFMVVDVRGNSGGNDATYFPVLPYLLTGPITLPANGFWLSEDNTQYLLNAFAASNDLTVEEFAEQEKEEYEMFIKNKGTAYFKGTESWTFTADTLYNGPKKVIVLIDNEVYSSGETFIYRVNQSDKVVVYGQNTAGVVDGFNGYPLDLGCFTAVFPTSYRAPDIKENPIDPYGIAPDVFVNEKEDVLAYAIKHMKQLLKNEKSK
ncbi:MULTISPECIES: S41 family peptidase [unclassified Leeuwenhoekiella]|uniref:S41 family peptidase n=1 Tax=unclassified Leeuwenhoekiella TaxID=2615029 RepID=UPI000C3CD5DB|nr:MULTISPECIES: S41 family peptidase [unclassified Leeuwenhoekiella]MAW94412.1 peptidase s41 [Leeuwenhoekiella sp.]MBA81089.1 peptidase s41 [Leeuwenhoekiella sp.]|tara:strand:- start:17944 stop:19398 length:1455 start_codon:yes stop_codon:yes gene_type:complete